MAMKFRLLTKHKRLLLAIALGAGALHLIPFTSGFVDGMLSYSVLGMVEVKTLIGALMAVLFVLTLRKEI
jgi:hypothetical protein